MNLHRYECCRHAYAKLPDDKLREIAGSQSYFKEAVAAAQAELDHRQAKRERQALNRFNMENDTKLGIMPKTSFAMDLERWREEREGYPYGDDKCKCDIHRLMAFGHDAGCKERTK